MGSEEGDLAAVRQSRKGSQGFQLLDVGFGELVAADGELVDGKSFPCKLVVRNSDHSTSGLYAIVSPSDNNISATYKTKNGNININFKNAIRW